MGTHKGAHYVSVYQMSGTHAKLGLASWKPADLNPLGMKSEAWAEVGTEDVDLAHLGCLSVCMNTPLDSCSMTRCPLWLVETTKS